MIGIHETLAGVVHALGGAEGGHVDEHNRWHIYQLAMDDPGCSELMQRAVQLEGDRSLAVSTVLSMIGRVDLSEHISWISCLRNSERPYCERRSREFELLRSVVDDGLSPEDVRTIIPEGSDWLQLRLADSISDVDVLEMLARGGRTRRIRGVARQRLKDCIRSRLVEGDHK